MHIILNNKIITQAFSWDADSTICRTCWRLAALSLVARIWPIAMIFSIFNFPIWLLNGRLMGCNTLLQILIVYWLTKNDFLLSRMKVLIISTDMSDISVYLSTYNSVRRFYNNHNYNINNLTGKLIRWLLLTFENLWKLIYYYLI